MLMVLIRPQSLLIITNSKVILTVILQGRIQTENGSTQILWAPKKLPQK